MRPGSVSLVGAGPGAADLLTRRAVRRLRQADVVFYDALVSPEVLALAPRARRFCVGRRAGEPTVGQAAIHRLMIRAARQRQRVVRLKGGDPFVFGRGGEEALALRTAGVPVEVVPGISAAFAAAGAAGIPVTHRGVASAVLVLSGHSERAYRPALDRLPPNSLTVVVMMGLASKGGIARLLLERGWRPATPVAILIDACRPGVRIWTGRLDRLGTAPPAPGDGGPATIVIGEVVSLSAVIGARMSGMSRTAHGPRRSAGGRRSRNQ